MPAPGHEPFLRAICENPDDDAPRLIYADWLDENGDSDRAEFIRLQIESGKSDAVERFEKRIRSELLFQENWIRWVFELPGSGALWLEMQVLRAPNGDSTQIECFPNFVDWERGFPAAVYVQSNDEFFLSRVDEVEQLVPVHRLRLISANNPDTLISSLSKLAFLKKVRELIVPPNVFLSNSTVTALANSPYANQLRQLSLVAERLNDSTGMALVNSQFLRDIDMLHLLRNNFSESVLAALRARYGFRVHC